MIARCPQCQTRFRLAPEKVGAQGARIRCSKCQTIFRVPPPSAEAAEEPAPAPKPAPEARAAPASAASASAAPSAPAAPPSGGATRGPKILVAEPDAEAAKICVDVLRRWGLPAEVLHDGAEALLWIFRNKPPAAVLGGHLPSVPAATISELVRRTQELSQVRLIRIAPLDEPVGAPEFEADRTVEPGELGYGLETALDGLDLGLRPAPTSAPAGAPPRPAAAEAPKAASKPAARPDSSDPEVAAAERLARIIVSDIVLYNQEKFQAAARSGNVAAALEPEITEASALFRQRIPEEVRAKRDFLIEELERRAKG